jgi:hypothetical protein
MEKSKRDDKEKNCFFMAKKITLFLSFLLVREQGAAKISVGRNAEITKTPPSIRE